MKFVSLSLFMALFFSANSFANNCPNVRNLKLKCTQIELENDQLVSMPTTSTKKFNSEFVSFKNPFRKSYLWLTILDGKKILERGSRDCLIEDGVNIAIENKVFEHESGHTVFNSVLTAESYTSSFQSIDKVSKRKIQISEFCSLK